MSLLTLYLVLLKATALSFNGPSSLPILRDELVVRRAVLTDRQLNAAVTASRCAPAPMGVYVVSVGYFLRGWPGAAMGWLAMVTPALAAIPVMRFLGTRARHRRVRRALEIMMVASIGLLTTLVLPMAREALNGWFTAVLCGVTAALLLATRISTLWIVGGCGLAAMVAARWLTV